MNITKMTNGPVIDWALDGAALTFAGALTVDLEAEARDVGRAITVFVDAAGMPSFEGEKYAAVIVVPPRQYTESEVDEEAVIVPLAINLDAVQLQLWALPTSEG
ncbi:hypothetical protein C8J27_11057 [Rhodobacter aestuarii]|uniref:Uncharacterized protein n=1 Tax=Rhodobacter aestuarii TaxID=453582 RepID=A0A1N7Q0T0_9RHOB|nr:hypothetical protein [Rhodobacter aestuarii]PTV94006.1 hypothetical protein C8J27_11057 [Rhodobacter aestuarii]SIT16450.1 hypothetical protein SAMN05421580_11257 [Rhodobacter aestuarii]